ncbi:hypothetical protein ABZ412_27260 [Nocardia sp. NPDC005746]|uniref:hypothetical protein n=1 Tax=unclassified Nocardia TaxID=2637762 RepID=UPI0033F7A02F
MQDASQVIVVDAANVVGSRPDGWWRDRAGAARRLLGELGALRTRLPGSTRIIVVLEGAAKAAADRGGDGHAADGESGSDGSAGVRVVLAGGSGDDTIVEVVAAEVGGSDPMPAITVVTADRGLRARVESLGATTVGPGWLRNHLS